MAVMSRENLASNLSKSSGLCMKQGMPESAVEEGGGGGRVDEC